MSDRYHSEDITFCSSECTKKNCYRHRANIRDHDREHTMAELKGTVYCQLRPEPPKKPKRRKKK